MKTLSIIIVNHNKFHLIKNCLDSLFKYCSHIDMEIIIVDNNSTEGNIEDVLKDYQNIRLIKNKENRGFGAANNQGIELAEGQYILFLNNDIVFFENSLEKLLDFIAVQNSRILLGCKLINADGSIQHSIVDFDNLINLFGENFFLYKILKRSKYLNKYNKNYSKISVPIEVDIIRGAFILAPKSFIDELNGFDERFFFYAEETDLCLRAKNNGGKVMLYPNTSVYHLEGGSTGELSWFKFENQTKSKLLFWQKHFSLAKFILAYFFHLTGLFLRTLLYVLIGLFSFRKKYFIKSFYFVRQILIFPKSN